MIYNDICTPKFGDARKHNKIILAGSLSAVLRPVLQVNPLKVFLEIDKISAQHRSNLKKRIAYLYPLKDFSLSYFARFHQHFYFQFHYGFILCVCGQHFQNCFVGWILYIFSNFCLFKDHIFDNFVQRLVLDLLISSWLIRYLSLWKIFICRPDRRRGDWAAAVFHLQKAALAGLRSTPFFRH